MASSFLFLHIRGLFFFFFFFPDGSHKLQKVNMLTTPYALLRSEAAKTWLTFASMAAERNSYCKLRSGGGNPIGMAGVYW